MTQLNWQSIMMARQTLGLPVDDATMSTVQEDLEERVDDLFQTINWRAEREWFDQNPGQLIPSEVTISLHQQALREAVAQIMDDEVNDPMQQHLIALEEAEETQRQQTLDAS
ncbi:hypothetical protein [Corynebacterium callunae]|uniref:Uncharacterized protein n=1 Tax=Corynebacterium callunae DSM 20147 TaxID=1121353 RepID=M1UJZ2_9CORY|nr:hypothetical protein [Corynebacterium callunae]AGG66204.1 hypothetical protein H924_03790 [Corynebacterium callunae DSM 20147]